MPQLNDPLSNVKAKLFLPQAYFFAINLRSLL